MFRCVVAAQRRHGCRAGGWFPTPARPSQTFLRFPTRITKRVKSAAGIWWSRRSKNSQTDRTTRRGTSTQRLVHSSSSSRSSSMPAQQNLGLTLRPFVAGVQHARKRASPEQLRLSEEVPPAPCRELVGTRAGANLLPHPSSHCSLLNTGLSSHLLCPQMFIFNS